MIKLPKTVKGVKTDCEQFIKLFEEGEKEMEEETLGSYKIKKLKNLQQL